MSRYRFIEVEKVNHAIRTLCRVLQVSRAAYYHWSIHPLSARARADLALTERIAAIHARRRQTYGAPRVHAELQVCGDRHGRKRVARLMHAAGLAGRISRRYRHTTVADPLTQIPDLVQRDFTPTHPLGGRHHLHPHLGGLAVPGDPPRLLLAPGGGVGDGRPPPHRAAAPGPAHGPGAAPPRRHPDPPHRPGLPIHVRGLHQRPHEPRDPVQPQPAGQLLGQRGGRELLLHSQTRPPVPPQLADPGGGEERHLEYIEVFYNRERRHSTLGNLSPADYESDHAAVCSA